MPAAYTFYDKTSVKNWGTVDGGWGAYTTTEVSMSQIRTGRSFGVLGQGRNDGQAWSTADYGVGVKYGTAKNQINTGVTPNACYPHYMVFMAAPRTPQYTMTAIKAKFGAYDWVAKSDLTKPTTPSAAADPNTPKAAGATSLLASTLLCLGIIIIQ